MVTIPPQDTLLCPHCNTRNAEEAVLCHFCGAELPREPMPVFDTSDDPFGTKDPVLETVRGMHGSVLRWLKRDEMTLGLISGSALGCGGLVFLLFGPFLLLIIVVAVVWYLR